MGFQKGSIRRSTDAVVVEDLGTVDYMTAWHHQAELARSRADGDAPDTLITLQHPATYTAGRRTQPEDLPTNGLPVIDVDRGGRITWHGPGQLVVYPVDVVDYVRRLEEAVIHTCRDLGLDDVGRVEGRSGVWLPAGVVDGVPVAARKVAAVGIRVTRGVAMHGIALNCDNSLEYYGHIVPCGLSDTGVTTLSRELGRPTTVADVRDGLVADILAALDGELPLTGSDIPEELAHGPVTGDPAGATGTGPDGC